MKLLDGKHLSQIIADDLKDQVENLPEGSQLPKLVVMTAGEDPASKVYVRNKESRSEYIGYEYEQAKYPEDVTEEHLLAEIERYNQDETVHGIIAQLPLPKHINTHAVIQAIRPDKDVDGFNYSNLGKTLSGDDTGFVGCTALGILEILKAYEIEIAGKHCVVVGRSIEVGKPIAQLMLKENATVTQCHSKTQDLAYHTRNADILIVATGMINTVTAGMVKPGSVVVDVGINRNDSGKLCGDVDFEKIKDVCAYITPVPGGVGPMTVAMLMHNTFEAYKKKMYK